VEDHALPTTGASQIATVVDGKSQVLYAFRLAMQYSTCLYVGTLVFVAVTICSICYRTLQVFVHVTADYVSQ
jgi:hypothetical protein